MGRSTSIAACGKRLCSILSRTLSSSPSKERSRFHCAAMTNSPPLRCGTPESASKKINCRGSLSASIELRVRVAALTRGSGIGLALVQDLVKLHGGTVAVESIYGQGSIFRVAIPPGQAHLPAKQVGPKQVSTAVGANAFVEEALRWLPEAANETMPRRSDTETSRLSSNRILFADDNADLRQYVQRLLSQTYEVQLAADGEAALRMARENPPDLVLADIMMPRLDGFGLLQALRTDPCTRNMPVILLSARAGEESRVEGLEAGANDYLIKPFSARELIARVSARLEIARLNLEAVEREHQLRVAAEDAEAEVARKNEQLREAQARTESV